MRLVEALNQSRQMFEGKRHALHSVHLDPDQQIPAYLFEALQQLPSTSKLLP